MVKAPKMKERTVAESVSAAKLEIMAKHTECVKKITSKGLRDGKNLKEKIKIARDHTKAALDDKIDKIEGQASSITGSLKRLEEMAQKLKAAKKKVNASFSEEQVNKLMTKAEQELKSELDKLLEESKTK